MIRVWVVPGASTTEIVGRHGDAVKVRVTAPPEAGRANRMVADLLAGALGSGGAVVVAGHGSRRKEVLVADLDAAGVLHRLPALGMLDAEDVS